MEDTRNNLRELRVQAAQENMAGNHSEYYRLSKEANQMEMRILAEEIKFYLGQYEELLSIPNSKSQLVYVGRILRKKQTRLESFNLWEV